MSYGKTVTLDAPFTQTVTRVRDAHAEQGFGVLTEIDVTATMHAKLGKDLEDYLILGACNPPLAYQALGIDRSLGLLLPCNIVVRAADDGTIVEILDPQIMATLTDRPELKPVADRSSTPPRRRARRARALTGDEPPQPHNMTPLSVRDRSFHVSDEREATRRRARTFDPVP